MEDPDGRATTFTYDDMSRLVETVSPDTGTTRARHDASGNLLSKTDAAGVVTTHTHDALNRRTRASFPVAGALPFHVISYLHDRRTDGNGRLTDLVTPTETTALNHDARGRVIRKTATVKW